MTQCSAEDLQMSPVGFVTLVDAFNMTKKCRADSIYLAMKTKKLGSNTAMCTTDRGCTYSMYQTTCKKVQT